jgi:hypothetical protein
MMDIGVARPSAQGQAMISTATALISVCARDRAFVHHAVHRYPLARPDAQPVQHLTEEHEHHDDRRRLEVHGNLAHHAERVGKQPGGRRRRHAIAVGGADAQRDRREHVQMPVHQRGPAAHEERPVARSP